VFSALPRADDCERKPMAAAKNAGRLPDGPQVVKEWTKLYLSAMRVRLNGEERDLRIGLTVADLVTELGLTKRRIAVELNRDILPRDAYERVLSDGDEVEIVHFIGGG
jgi:thiamine biosynthesis protein ThiS